MPKTITMPKLGSTMEEGKIVEWKKSEGSLVQKKELLVVIESDKVALEYEAPEAGVLATIIAKTGDTVAVGQPICLIAEAGEKLEPAPARPAGGPAPQAQAGIQVSTPSAMLAEKAPGDYRQIQVVPLVRKLAEELGIPLQEVKGTGPGGRITKDDLLQYAEEGKRMKAAPPVESVAAPSPSASPAGIRKVKIVIPLKGTRGTIAKRMAASFQNPQGTQFRDIDITEMLALRDLLKEGIEKETGHRLTLTALLIKTVTQALLEHPIMNAIIEDGKIQVMENINMGIATAYEDGLVVPVIHDVQAMSLAQILVALANLTDKARKKKLTQQDISGGTFTITNMGMYEAEHFTPLLNPPELAILGVGAIRKKPVVLNDQVQVRPILPLSLAFDHRGTDGVPAAQFFSGLKAMLESPPLLTGMNR